MKRFAMLLAICVSSLSSAQDKPIPWAAFQHELGEMQARVESMGRELDEFNLKAIGKEAGVKDVHGWLSAWSGWLYLEANDARAFHSRHVSILYDTRWGGPQPAQVHPRYLQYYRDGMKQFEEAHRKLKKEFGEFANAWVGEVIAYERGGDEGKTAAEAVTKKEGNDWKKLVSRVCFERRVVEGPLPAPKILSIGKLTIDYTNWHVERMSTSEDARRAQMEIEARTRDMNAKRAEVRQSMAEVVRLRSAYSRAVQALTTAERTARGESLNLTSPQIQAAQRQHSTAIRDLAQVDSQLRTAKGARRTQLVSRQRALRTQRDQAKRRVEMLTRDLREDTRAQAQASLERLINAKYDALKPLARAESELNIQAGVLDTITTGYREAVDRYDALYAKLGKLGAEAPLITKVTASGYEATLWEPDVLDDLDRDIQALEGLVREFDTKRRHHRQELIRASEEMDRMAQALASSQWSSVAAQAGVEIVFTGVELVNTAKNGGAAGILAEASKKIVENLLFPVTYADPTNLIPSEDTWLGVGTQLLPDRWAAATSTGQQLVKSGVTGYGTSYAMEAYLRSQARSEFQSISSKLVTQSWFGSADEAVAAYRRNLQIAPVLDQKKRILEAAEKKLAEVGSFKGYVKQAGKDMFVSQIKNITKDAAKQALANLIEGEAWQDHKAAELAYRSRVLLLYQASNNYWKTHDALEHTRALRRSLFEQYDPGSSMKVNNRGSIESDDDLVFELSDRGADAHRPSNREVDLYFGEVKAERIGEGALVFKVSAAKLQEMATAPHDVRIVFRG